MFDDIKYRDISNIVFYEIWLKKHLHTKHNHVVNMKTYNMNNQFLKDKMKERICQIVNYEINILIVSNKFTKPITRQSFPLFHPCQIPQGKS